MKVQSHSRFRHLVNCIYICCHITLLLPCICTFVLRISPLQARGLFSDLCFSLVGKAGLLNHDFLLKKTYSIPIFWLSLLQPYTGQYMLRFRLACMLYRSFRNNAHLELVSAPTRQQFNCTTLGSLTSPREKKH